MEKKAVKTWIIIALLLMSMALMANASTEKTGGTVHAPNSFSTTSAPPPIEWNQTYGGAGDDRAYSVINTTDGGYALAGYTNSFGAGGYDFWLVKTDSAGNMQWNQTYGGAGDDCARSIVQTSDGGYALAGYTYSFGAGGYDFWLVKTDSAGNMQWNQTYGGTGDDYAYSVVQTSDGGYALAGYTNSFGAGGYDFYLVKARSCTLTINATTGGTTSLPAGTYSYSVGTVVTVNANADANYVFDHWMFDNISSTSNPINVTMNADHTLQAFFTRTYTLTIAATAGGTTNPTPGTYITTIGTVVTVNATPYANYLFDHWTLETNGIFVNSTTNPIPVTMNANHSLQAFFTPSYTLTITTQPPIGGTTSPLPGTYINSSGTVVNVTASANTGYYLYYWKLDGNNNGTQNPISITMNMNHTLIAVFVLRTYTLTVNANAGGTTSPSGTGNTYSYGTVVNVTASPNSTCYFDHWELDTVNVGAANPINITMYNDHALYAVFEPGPSPTFYTLNITANAGGTTSPLPGTYIYSNETVIAVTAWPNATYCLDHWELDGNNTGATNPMNVTMDMDHALYAVFVPYHDVAVTNVWSKKVTCQGFNCSITVAVTNLGKYTETFNVTAYVNYTDTGNTAWNGTRMYVTLLPGTFTYLTFYWNTSGFVKGNYTLSACAWPVPGETNIANNNFTDGLIRVSIVGDLTGGSDDPWAFIPDGVVDGSDLSIVAKCYGSWPAAKPPLIWNPNCDVNNDGVVDGSDLSIVARHFGEGGP
jgi:predicted secreted protein